MTLAVNIAQGGSNNVTFRNKIINGAMVINQRGFSGSVTTNQYTLDRWQAISPTDSGKFSVSQSSTTATGFSYSLLATSLTAYTVLTNDRFSLAQAIEGYNTADLSWGTANAQTVTLSFWVRSSLTGTFGGALQNSDGNRSYPFTFTISSANTFEYKTITVAGPTSGTWFTTNGVGMYVYFGLGVGATYSGTAGAWANTDYRSATGATSLVSTNGATLYITGVQLEAGTTASPFEYRQYGTEFDLCRRYYEKFDFNDGTSMMGAAQQTNQLECLFFFYPKRTGPTVTVNNGTYYRVNDWRGGDEGCNGTVNIATQGNLPYNSTRLQFQKATSNLTVGYGGYMNKQGGAAANPMLYVSAEL